MKIALVHDDFCQLGGAENLFAAIAQIYPEAPIYTALADWKKLPASIGQNRVRPSFMQKIPFAPKLYKLLLPLYPLAFESFDFSKYDLVISSTTRFAKGIITKPKTLHISYINSTPRFLWHENSKGHYLKNWQGKIASPLISWLKRYDKAASARPDFYFANSQNVAGIVKKDYSRNAAVVYPFADTDFFTPKKFNQQSTIDNQQSYYLVVARLVRWKRVDLAIKACAKLGINLKIVGEGPDKTRLKKLAQSAINNPSSKALAKENQQSSINNQQSTIEFLGSVSRERLRELYQNAKALIVTQEEDFGISTVEAQACGIPVIAQNLGGQKEIIIDEITGLFFDTQSQNSLEDAIMHSTKVKWDVSACRKNSHRFKRAIFVKDFQKAITDKIKAF